MPKTHYHAVLIDETGCEFGAGCDAETREEAYEQISENYPESRIVQLESPEDTRERQAFIEQRLRAAYDDDRDIWDDPYLGDEGRW